MLHNNMDLQIGGACPQVEDNRNKGGVRDARRPQPQDQGGPNNGGHRKIFSICEKPKFKNGA